MSTIQPTQTIPVRRLYRVPEVATLLGVGRTTVYSLMNSGALPAVLLGADARITAEGLDAYIAGLPTISGQDCSPRAA